MRQGVPVFVPRLRYRKHAGCPARTSLFLLLVVLVAVTAPHRAFSTPVTATITGYVTSGKNCYTGTEGCIFGTVSDLTDLPFTLTYSYDDSYGTEDGVACNTGANGYQVYTSTISNSGTSNPGTAELTITVDDNDYNFFIGDAGFGQTSITSTGTRELKNTCHSDDYAYFKVDAGYGSGGYSGGSSVSAYAYPEGTSLGGTGDWRVPIVSVDTHQWPSYIYFSITVASGGTYQDYAYGYLTPYTFSLDGFYEQPDHETTAPASPQWNSGLAVAIANWKQTLHHASSNDTIPFSGYQNITEVASGTTTDSCYSNARANNSGQSDFPAVHSAVSGGTWNVDGSNVWQPDQVGWLNPSCTSFASPNGCVVDGGEDWSLLAYYQQYGITGASCNFTGGQEMEYLNGGTFQPYGGTNSGDPNTLTGIIYPDEVGSQRAGYTPIAVKTFP